VAEPVLRNVLRPAGRALRLHWQALQRELAHFAWRHDALDVFRSAFGSGIDADGAERIIHHWQQGRFGQIPTCRLVAAGVLRGARAAYAAADHAILLDRRWLASAHEQDVLRVLLEEVGHGLDAGLNLHEAPGDEGAIFASLVLGDPLDETDLARLRAEEDRGWILLDGRLLLVEFSASLTEGQLTQLREGIHATLGNLETAVAAQVLNQALPLFGSDLHASFLAGVPELHRLDAARQAIDQALAALAPPHLAVGAMSHTPTTILLQQAANAINTGLQNAGLVPAGATPATVTPGNEITINTGLLGGTYTQSLSAQTGFGIGSVVKASSDGTANLNVNYGIDITLGVDTDFYVRTTGSAQEVTFNLALATAPSGLPTNPNLTVGGDITVGPFQVFSATVLPTTGLDAAFQMDLQDADGKLYRSELNSSFNYAKTTASGDLDLDLRLGTPQALDGLLTLRTDLLVDWSFSQDASGLYGSAPTITFADTEVDFLSFLTDTLLPFLERIRVVLDPIKDVIGVLTADIEALSGIDGAGDWLDVVDGDNGYQPGQDGIISLLDLAVLAEVPGIDAALAFFDVLDTIEDAYSLLNGQVGAEGFYALGDLDITSDVREGSFSLQTSSGTVTGARDELDSFMNTAFGGASPAALRALLGTAAGNVAAPVLADAQASLGYLFGQNVDVLRFDMPKLAFAIGDRIAADGSFTGGSLRDLAYVPIFFPSLSFEIEAALRAVIDIDFGYDTRGLQHYIESGTPGSASNLLDASKLLDGLYITDWGPGGQERPEVVLGAKFNFGAGLGADRLAKFFVGGSIEGTINLDITDGANGGVQDGKVYLDELAAELTDPNGFFEGYGFIEAYMTAYAELLFLGKEWNSPSVQLFDFSFGDNRPAPFDPQLASVSDDNLLLLHIGPNAGFRATPNQTDGVEQFSVSASGSDKLRVAAFGYEQLFATAGLAGINAAGGTSDDLINIGRTVALAATLSGGLGQDVLGGGAGADNLDGDENSDFLSGADGNDDLLGGDGDDVLSGGAGADTLDGGSGTDTATYATAKQSVQVALNGLAGIAGEGVGDRLFRIEKVVGADIEGVGDGIVVGGQLSGEIVLSGLRGDDTLEGGATDDVLIGGLGDDMLIGAGGANTLAGGLGNDLYILGSAGDFVDEDAFEEGGGRDTALVRFDYSLLALGNIEDLELRQNGGVGTGNALGNLILGSGRDTDAGDDWHDTLRGLEGRDTISGRKGDDRIEGGADDDELDGGTGSDSLWGDAGADTLRGGSGADSLTGGTSADHLDGGAGNDTYAVDHAGDIVVEAAGGGTRDRLVTAVDYLLGTDAEIEEVSGSDAVSTTPLSLRGNRFAQVLAGNAGDDVLEGMGGADTLRGGLGRDIASYEHADARVLLDLGAMTLQGDAAGDVFDSVEAFRGTDGHADTLRGTTGADDFNGLGGADRLAGVAGDDTLFGGDGADTLDGGAGNDLMAGGASNDVYLVNSAQDVVDDGRAGYRSGSGGRDRIIASLDYTLGTAERSDIEELQLTGAARTGTGNALGNLILGTTGADTLDGGTGADDLRGGAGNDRYLVDDPGDRVVEAAAGGVDELRIATAFFHDGFGGVITFDLTADWLTEVEHAALVDEARALHLRGNALSNRLVSNDHGSSIAGGDGDDTIDPGLGSDVVAGGDGNDRLVVDFSPYSGEGGVVYQAAGRVDFYNRFSSHPRATLTYSDIESFDLTGTTGGDVLFGAMLADRLIGNDGGDILDSATGANETVQGDGGDDRWIADLGDVTTAILLNLAASQGMPALLSNGTSVSTVEMLTLTLGSGDDHVSAAGFAHADIILGGAGNDTIDPGRGSDSTGGGEGTDRLVVDFFAYSGEGGVVIQGVNRFDFFNRFSGNPQATLRHDGFESFDLRGTTGGDVLFGAALNDRLCGEAGDDNLNSASGAAETIEGGEGQDRWIADLGGVTTAILLDLTASQTAPAILSSGTRVSGIELLTLTLGSGDDRISAADFHQADTILGGAGNDTIDPGRGSDSIRGGDGIDRLVVDFFACSGEGGVVIQGVNRFDFFNRFSGNPQATLRHDGFESFDLRGTTGGDVLFGAALGDRLRGEAGDDNVNSASGSAETIEGGDGQDRWIADLGDVTTPILLDLAASQTALAILSNGTSVSTVEMLTLTLGSGDDHVSAAGFAHADTILGGAGNDTVDPGRGSDSIGGGEGTDRLVVDFFAYSGEGGVVIQGVNRFDFFNRFSGNPQATLRHDGFESFDLRGTTGGDLLSGAALGDRLRGEAGDDMLDSGSGLTDTIDGGEGQDRWIADLGTARNSIKLDLLAAQGEPLRLASGTFVSRVEMLTLTLGSGHDRISAAGLGHADTIVGSAGNDTIDPGRGNDSVDGGADLDQIILDFNGYSGEGGAVIQTVGRFDFYNRFSGHSQATLHHTSIERFHISGTTGNDSFMGADLADTLLGGAGRDILRGGLGNDVYQVDDADDAVLENADEGVDLIRTTVALTIAANVEDLLLLASEGLRGTGNALANRITGGAGNDELDGAWGDDSLAGGTGGDTLTGGLGADSMAGEAGDDTYHVDDAGDRTRERRGGGTDTILASVSWKLASHTDDLVLLGEGDLSGTGNTLANNILGNAGANELAGGRGADTLLGGTGNDTYRADRFDLVIEQPDQGFDTIITANSFDLAGVSHVEVLQLIGTLDINGIGNAEDTQILGNAGANKLEGGAGADTLLGGRGDDTLLGEEGDDSLSGGSGADALVGGAGNDVFQISDALAQAFEARNGGTDLVQSSVSFTLGNHLENLLLTGNGAIGGAGNGLANVITGNNAANTLSGGDGADTLFGGGGADTLLGGDGGDELTGAAGADRFLFGSLAERGDVITDFTPRQDILAVSAAALGGGLAPGALPAAGFVSHASDLATAAPGAAQFVYNSTTGQLSFDSDGLGGAVAVKLATFTSKPALGAGDLILV
jgi:Ca2+-binding RTX toxin-like protein